MPFLMSLAGGVLLGLASSLHCAAMCGGIASGLMASGSQEARPFYRTLLLTHVGRISAYMTAGIAVGAAGASVIGWLDREVAFRLLQWGGAVALMWIGLSTAGMLPGPSWLDRAMAPLSNGIARLSSRIGGRRPAPYLMGFAWGLMPCAMVYGALFTATLTGSAAGGATVMAGFGLGTLPGLVVTTLGIRALVRAEMRTELRMLAGFAIALFGFATVWVPHPMLAALCLPS